MYKNIYGFLGAALIAGVLLTGCRDDDIFSVGDNPEDYRPAQASLVFDIDLAPFGNENDNNNSFAKEPDHGEGWENYIDPAKFRVLFCDIDGNYLFETNRRNISIISKDHHWSGVSGSDHNSAYRIFITREELEHVMCTDPECFTDPDRAERHKKAIRNAIYGVKNETTGKYEGGGFKVAVLANWPAFVEGERQRDSFTGDELLGPANVSTDLDFSWHDGEKLGWNEEDRARNTKIGYLSQCIFDNVYGQPDHADEDGSNPVFAEPYEHIVYKSNKDNVGKMGVFTSWVSYLYISQRDAEDFIRAGLDQNGGDIEGIVHFTYDYGFENNETDNPEAFWYKPYSYTRTVDADNVYSLENIWRLFNFSAGANCPLYVLSDKAKDYWHMRTENVLLRELSKVNWGTDGSTFMIKDHSGDLLVESNNPKSKYVPVSGTSGGYLSVPDNGVKTANIQKMEGGISSKNDNLTDAENFRNNAIHFRAYGEGHLRIRAKAGGQGKISVLTKTPTREAQKLVPVYNGQKEGNGYIFVPGTSTNTRDDIPEVEFLIDPSSEEYLDVYIASVDGTVQFYEIEYMRARHIYDSARNAVMPSKTNPIPMYGIQNFDVIGDYVEALPPNETFNLSDKEYNSYLNSLSLDPYDYKDIFLLRSLAKVELRFKKSVFEKHFPEHVMMRVMNRTARCEPRDVVNPTEWIWYGNAGIQEPNGHLTTPNPIDQDADPSKFAGADREFKNIMDYYKIKPLYDAGTSSIPEYRNRTAWFYGFWSEEGSSKYYWQVPWAWNGMNPKVDQTYPFPRIFNTRIDRSDYCRFHHVPDKDGYIRFIMYVPEKNITDTDSKGQLSATPKVQHIEIRFRGMNDVMNFDDDDCYRIYFTDYKENGQKMKDINRYGGYTDFEKDSEALKTLQPIMRNCHYIFEINSINDKEIGVGYSVCGAASRTGQTFVIN